MINGGDGGGDDDDDYDERSSYYHDTTDMRCDRKNKIPSAALAIIKSESTKETKKNSQPPTTRAWQEVFGVKFKIHTVIKYCFRP